MTLYFEDDEHFRWEGLKLPNHEDIVRDKVLQAMLTNMAEVACLRKLPYDKYLQTRHWRTKVREALDRADHRCQLCGSEDRLCVHHNTYERLGCERPSDLIVLCQDCHARHHDKLPPPPLPDLDLAEWDCPECGAALKPMKSRYGPFLGCVRFPECRGLRQWPKSGSNGSS